MSYSVQNIRNVCLLGHGGNGKTSLAESMLYLTGGTVRLGNPADGNTVCDYDPEETRRQISISTAVAPVEYNGCKINVLDTPGYFDFSGEVIEALQVCLLYTSATQSGGAEIDWPEPTCTVDYKPQSDSVSCEFVEETGDAPAKLVYTIQEGAEGDQVLELSKLADALADTVQYPGDAAQFDIEIHNESGNSYRYKPGSFTLASADTSGMEQSELLPVLGYDGQWIPFRFTSSMVSNQMLKDLFNTSSVNISLEQIVTLYDTLAEEGYDSLTNYFVCLLYTSLRGSPRWGIQLSAGCRAPVRSPPQFGRIGSPPSPPGRSETPGHTHAPGGHPAGTGRSGPRRNRRARPAPPGRRAPRGALPSPPPEAW